MTRLAFPVRRLHGDIPQLLSACDAIERSYRVLWAIAPGTCPGHPNCFRLTVVVLRRHRLRRQPA
jgi:hypothetical protein